jgi:hypothetical protein
MGKFLGEMLGKPIHGKSIEDTTLPIPTAKVGIEVELERWGGQWPDRKYWTGKGDGSLRNDGVEFVTNGGMCGLDIAVALRNLCTAAVTHGWDVGYPRAGIHLHLDVTDLDWESGQLARLVANYMIVEHAMISFAGDWRRECGYCVPFDLGQGDFDRLSTILYNKDLESEELIEFVGELSKYQALNLKPLSQFGTIEFRALPTTFDYGRIMTWVKIVLALKRSAMTVDKREPLEILSELGPLGYIRWILGDCADSLMLFVQPHRVWEAVDNVNAILAYAGKFKTSYSRDWSTPSLPNPFLVQKKSKLEPTPKKAKVTKEQLQF